MKFLRWLGTSPSAFFLVATAIAFLFMGVRGIVLPTDEIASFQYDSDELVTGAIEHSASQGRDYLAGFMGVYGISEHRKVIAAVSPEKAESRDIPYISNTGLQYKVIQTFSPHGVRAVLDYYVTVKAVMLLIMASILAAIGLRIRLDYGLFAGAATVLLLMAADQPMIFGKSLYWVGFTLFLPFTVLFTFYRAEASALTKASFIGLFGLALFVRFLCGYEYITCLTLSGATAIAYHELRRPHAWRAWMGWSAAAIAVAVMAFLIAIGVHYRQCLAYFGTPELAFKGLTLPWLYNTVAGEGIRTYPVNPKTIAKQIYLLLTTPILGHLSAIEFLPFTILGFLAFWRTRSFQALVADRDLMRLVYATTVGIGASATWIAATHHFVEHPYMGMILIFLPAMPMIFALTAVIWARALRIF
jgi:hypothetical protein